MKSISHGTVRSPHQVGHEEDGALEHADEQQIAARVVGRDLVAELGDARRSASSSIRTSPTPARARVSAHSLPLRRSRRAPRRCPAPRRPRRRARRAATPRARSAGPSRPRTRPGPSSAAREPVARRASRAREGRAASESIRHGAPAHLARRARPGPRSSQRRSYSRTAWTPPPRSTPLRAARAREQLRRAALGRSSASAEQVLLRAPGGAARSSGRISSRIRPRTVSRVRRVDAERQPVGAAVRLGLLAPERQQRPDDAVLALRLDPARAAARDEPVEDRLDLVGGRVAGRAQPVGRERVARSRKLGLGRPAARRSTTSAPSTLAAEARVLVGLLAAQAVVHVERRDAVAELARARARGRSSRRRPRRGRATSPPGAISSWRADVLLDRRAKVGGVHRALLSPVSVQRRRREEDGPAHDPATAPRDRSLRITRRPDRGSSPPGVDRRARAGRRRARTARRADQRHLARGHARRRRPRKESAANGDDEDRLLRPLEHDPEAARVALDDRKLLSPPAGRFVSGPCVAAQPR